MNRSERDSDEPNSPDDRTRLFRGAVVSVSALLVGILVISQGFGTSTSETSDSGVESTESGSSTTSPVTDILPPPEATIESPPDGPEDSNSTPVETSLEVESTLESGSQPEVPAEEPQAARPPSETIVLVLNSSAPTGSARRVSARLGAEGYRTRKAKNVDSRHPSAVLFREGYQLEAEAVASALGIESGSVNPFNEAESPTRNAQGANILVVVSDDGGVPAQ